MESVKSGLLLLSIVYITVCYARPSEKSLFQQHKQRVDKLQCSQPQPRVVELKDIIPEEEWNEKYEDVKDFIYPAVTVLDRCYASGCCKDRNERCMPIKVENVTLTFAIMTDSREYFQTVATNHLLCGCKENYERNIK